MLIKNGIVVTPDREMRCHLLVEGGKIAKIGDINCEDYEGESIDASGKYVLPGGVDVHTHFDLDAGAFRAADDFYMGTVAAAYGGVTSFVDHMAFGPKGCSLGSRVEEYHRLAEGKAVIDYGFHGVIQHMDGKVIKDMEALIDEGITSYKLYMTYDFMLQDEDILKAMAAAKELGLILAVHGENNGIISYFRELYRNRGLLSPVYHAQSRPSICEAEAINRLLLFSEILGDVPLYIVHLSTGEGLRYIQEARKRGLKNVFAETCPQYLVLDQELYNRPDGLKFICSPPLRAAQNNGELWRGIQKGFIQTIATDHCPFFYEGEKQLGAGDFTKCPNGLPGVETRIPIIFSEGVLKNRISPLEFTKLCSENPAKLFGLYPKKGVIREGADADLVIIDPDKKSVITKDKLHENVDYTPYEGICLSCSVDYTISRGEIIVKDNMFLGKKGRGLYIRRKPPAFDL